jgi:hypothetical protein
MNDAGLTRRELLASATATGLVLLTASRGRAQQRELIANTYGGGWETGHRAAIASPLEKRLGV